MALDLEAIRRKLAQVSGQNSRRNSTWRPEKDKTAHVRIVPFKDNEGQPFKERWFYYNIANVRGGLLTPHQFGKADPFQEFIDKLMDESRNADSKEDGKAAFEMAKTLFPKVRHYAPVIVRGEEDKGVRLWGFGKQVCEALYRKMLDEDYGDITDLEAGNDIKITVEQASGAKWASTIVDVRPKKTALSDDGDQMSEWLENVPDLDALFQLKTHDQLDKLLSDHIRGDTEDDSDGTERGGSSTSTESTSDKSDDTSTDSDGDGDSATEAKIDDIFNAIAADQA